MSWWPATGRSPPTTRSHVVFDAAQNSSGTSPTSPRPHCVHLLSPSIDYPDLLALPARRRAVIDAERYPG